MDQPDAIGADYLRIVGLTFLFLGAFRVVQGGFRGSGSTRTAMFLSIAALFVFRVPPAYVLVEWFDMGATGVWYAIAFSNVAILVVAVAWFLRGTWTTNVVDGAEEPTGAGDRPPTASASGPQDPETDGGGAGAGDSGVEE